MERGQATLEYVAVIAVIAIALAVLGAVAGADAVPKAVAAQVHRAICLVEGGDCLAASGPRPCTVSARGGTSEKRVKAWLVRLADGREVLTEEQSDGTAVVTVLDFGEALGGPKLPKRLEARLGVRLGGGRRWVLPDAAAARRLVAGLDADRLPVGAAAREALAFLRREDGADERFVRFGSRGEASATLRAVGVGTAIAGLAYGLRLERATGRRIVEIVTDREAAGRLAQPFMNVMGGVERQTTIELAFTRAGEPETLTIRRSVDVHGEVRIGPTHSAGGNRAEGEARLDLTHPRARALASAFLDRARNVDPSALSAAADLGRHLAQNARIDVRLFATTHEERTGGLAPGGVGYEKVSTVETARLIEAYGREPGLGWSRRLDCLGVA